MLYIYLKILHIVSASLVLASMAYSFHLWRAIQPGNFFAMSGRIQKQTSLVIIPFAIFQLVTGFTMVSLKHDDWQSFRLGGSIISFILVILGWCSFCYFLSQHARRLQGFMLLLCAFGLLCMIFLMANKNG